jgi:lipopolysaccharide export system protein LptA
MNRRNKRCLLAMGAVLFSLWLPAAPAAEGEQDEPIHVSARAVEANEKTGVAVYTGNVLAEQGRLAIRADRIEIRARDNRTEFIHATGKPVKLKQLPEADEEELDGEANQVEYHVGDRKLDMMGDVTLRRGKDLFTGHVLHYDMNAKSMSAAGDIKNDGRVHAVIQPPQPAVEPPAKP